MLGGIKLKVCYTHERNCFAYISQKHSTNKEQNQCIQVLNKDKQLLLWVIYSSSVPEGHIACNPIYGRHLGLKEGFEVFVSPYNDVKILDELYIDADSAEDQEILEHNAELLQLRLLDQLRLVSANQKAVVWLSVSLPIVFTPKQTGLLVNQSRVVVKVDAFNTMRKIDTTQFDTKAKEPEFKSIGLINEGMLKPYLNVPEKLILRAFPIDKDSKEIDNPFKVFLHKDFISKKCEEDFVTAVLESIPSIVKNGEEQSSISDLCVQIQAIDNFDYVKLSKEVYNQSIPTLLIPKYLNRILNIENGVKLKLTFINEIETPEHVEIQTYSDDINTEIDIIDRLKSIVIDGKDKHKKYIINNEIVQQNSFITRGYIKFKLKPDKLKYTVLNPESFKDCSISAKFFKENELSNAKLNSNLLFDSKSYCRSMKLMEKMVRDVVMNLYFEIHRDANFKGVSEIKSNVLITGLSGTGKSSLCQIIQNELTVWSQILHCRSLKGRKDIPEAIAKAILSCQEHSPSVLICDDVDSLVPAEVDGASPQDIAYYQRLAVVLKRMLQSCSGVSVLMTALSVKSLHPTLRKFTGKPLFTAHCDIKELDQSDRKELFNHLLTKRVRTEFVIEDDDVIKLSMDTAGMNVRDITDYLNKKIFKAVKRKGPTSPDTKPRLIEGTLKETSDQEIDVWAPIGGMHQVKQELTECIFWPLKYPALFPSQSCGILLYGPPGTGKSFIGSCVGTASGLNFLAVKGPELLSKYIGQSEKAVRDIFDKADMKKPCVLFFDEFDSLAPKRGHDSTGVTDRVVNQLLSRLDGAEGGASGPVIAATSRPDLVDPALLRAGRLQTHVYCALPDLEDRKEVLQTLSKDVSLDPEVDLDDIATRTEGFSPADLKSLLVTAQLASLEHQLSIHDGKDLEAVIVGKENIENAFEETKPSLSPEQRRFYDMIYKRFRGESLNPEETVMSSQFQKQRVTLA